MLMQMVDLMIMQLLLENLNFKMAFTTHLKNKEKSKLKNLFKTRIDPSKVNFKKIKIDLIFSKKLIILLLVFLSVFDI